MKRLSKKQEERRSCIAQELSEAGEAAKIAFETFVEKVQEAEEFRAEMASDMGSYYDDRSERWQEGDVGSAYSEWKEAWEEEFEIPEPPEWDEIERKLNDLPLEPDC